MKDRKIVYVDGVDWQHEMGETDVATWPSLSSVLERTPCARNSCGVVKCEVKLIEWVHPQNLGGEDALTKEQRINIYEKHIEWYRKRIDHYQHIVERMRSERVEQDGAFEIISNCEGIKISHTVELRNVAQWLCNNTAIYYDHGGRSIIENETLDAFKQYCIKQYKVKFEGHGYSAQEKG